MRKSPRSPRFDRTFPLAVQWQEKTLLTDTDNPYVHRERFHREIQRAIRCGQTYIVMFLLRVRDAELTGVAEATVKHERIDNSEYLYFSCDKQLNISPSMITEHSLIPLAGYKLNGRFLSLLRWLRQNGLCVGLSRTLCLICYWHPDSAHEGDQNALYKVALSKWIAGDDVDIMAHYRKVIMSAMDAGQTRAVLCIVYDSSGYCCSSKHHTRNDLSTYMCTETRDILSDQVISADEWYMTTKHVAILDWLTQTEQLQWSLRFSFADDRAATLYPWALLVAIWC